jgi:predicted small metal-binding protein
MPTLKKFVCHGFNPDIGPDCPCIIIHEQDPVMDIVVYHEVKEHGEEDTPELRQKIIKNLVDA